MAVVNFDLLALDADVGDPVLAATVGASGDVKFQMLIETGQAFFQFFDQPAREALCLRDGELAEFCAAARHRAAPESRTADLQSDRVEFFRQRFSVERGHIDDQQVLHVGGAQFATGKALGEIRGRLHLLRRDSPAQRHRSHVRETGLLLRMDADVVAVNVVGRMLLDCGIELESDAVLQFGKKAVGGPSVAQEEKFQPSALAMFAQHVGVAEQLGNSFDHRQNLVPADERIQPCSEIRFGRESACDSQGEADLGRSANACASARSGRCH